MKFRVAFLSLTVAALLIGCAQAPQVELDAAKAAVDTAKAAQAEMYAPEALAEVQQAMTAAEAEIAAQAEKLAFLRKYDTAKQLIADATTKAEAARQAAIDGKAAAKAAAEEAVTAANTALTMAQDTLASLGDCKKKPKDFASQVELMNGTLSGLAARIGELSGMVANEDFSGATQAAGALSAEIGTFQADLDNAKTKLGC